MSRDRTTLAGCVLALRQGRGGVWHEAGASGLQTRADQWVYHAADPVDDLYLLAEGLAVVVGGDSPSQVLLVLRAPALWGDVEVVAARPVRSSGLRSIGVARLLRFSAGALKEASLTETFLKWHRRDLAVRMDRMLVGGTGVWQHLETRLARLCTVFEDHPEHRSVEVLAKMTGSTPGSVRRILRTSDFAKRLDLAQGPGFVHSFAQPET